MDNELLITLDTPYTLNFLIYIQNIFLNQHRRNEIDKHPFLPSKVDFNENFASNYKDVWDEIVERIAKPQSIDMKIFYEEKDLFYHRLFVMNSDSFKLYAEIYKAFEVWWASLAGGFSVERTVDEQGRSLYLDLAKVLLESDVKLQRPLKISLIYDECLLANEDVSYYFAVLPVSEFFFKYKALVPKLQGCFY